MVTVSLGAGRLREVQAVGYRDELTVVPPQVIDRLERAAPASAGEAVVWVLTEKLRKSEPADHDLVTKPAAWKYAGWVSGKQGDAMQPYFYDRPILPEGFRFPAAYREYIPCGSEDLAPWKMLSLDMAGSLYYWAALQERFPDLALVPFAILSDESGHANDGYVVVVCFDGWDRTGSPRVLVYDYEHPRVPPNKTKGFTDFSEWLVAARREASEFRGARADDSE